MIWILDTSAWARRDVPAVKHVLGELAKDPEVELVLSPAVLLELLRGPQGAAVSTERRRLEESFRVLTVDDETFRLAATAMERLARVAAEAHRLPIADLVTSGLAHQHHAGVLHFDSDYDAIAKHGGLKFETREVCRPRDEESASGHPLAATQRARRKELAQLLHRLPVDAAEAFLDEAIERLRRSVSG